VKAFSQLLDRLSYTSARNGKLALMQDYFLTTPDPDRGFTLAALTDSLPISLPIRKLVLELASAHIDPELFRLSRDYVGDTAETLSLIWPDTETEDPPQLAEVVETVHNTPKTELPQLLTGWLNRMDVNGRWALLKLLGGGLRSGVSARLAKTALAQGFGKEIDQIEQAWHGIHPPYTELFAWLEGKSELPDFSNRPVFRPLMLSHPLEDADLAELDPADYQIEWKWDGIRVQVSARDDIVKLYSRTGDDITESFLEFKTLRFNATLDGELLVGRGGEAAPFQDLQQRLNRKSVTRKMLTDYPAFIRLYDMLDADGQDVRSLPLAERRSHLEAWHADHMSSLLDLSEVLSIPDRATLDAIWSGTRDDGIEGLMLKRRDSTYVSGRPKGLWWKWKRAALTADCVMIYAQRGSGKRSSFYSDYTFACWDDTKTPRELVPVGKAYSGFTDDELKKLDHFVRHNTRERFGPVRQVEATLVLEVAFDAIQLSKRHKSGVAMRFPRIHRIRWDKPAEEADTVQTLRRMITNKTMDEN
jgi:DNA ligase 1